MAEHPLKGLYLTRLYRDGADPFQVVSDQPFDEAVALSSKFAGQRYVHGKKGDQIHYMEARIETEGWLRESARQEGVDIRKQNPVYFTLTTEPHDGVVKNGMRAISYPAEKFDLACCSFTYGDSMGNRKTPDGEPPNPLEGVVMNAEGASQAIKTHGLQGDYIKGGRYVEVQVWAHPPDAVLGSHQLPVLPEVAVTGGQKVGGGGLVEVRAPRLA